MSSRRERPPSGRVNLHPVSARSTTLRPLTAHTPSQTHTQTHTPSQANTPSSSARSRQSFGFESTPQRVSARPSTSHTHTGGGMNALCSTRSHESELSTGEVLRRMREKTEARKNAIDEREILALGDYNAFSRPRKSEVAPLRTVLLDPAVNNFPHSRTREQLMKRIKSSGVPHPSYDLDNDGYVSQEDFRLAKRFDFDGNGVLDPDERNVGKHILAEEFFKEHEKDVANFGPSFAKNTKKQNIAKLVNAYSFERSYGKLKQVERTLKAESSKPLIDCIRNDTDEIFQKNKYHTNKFDSTAWTDYDRVPRNSWMGASLTEDEHKGSRRRLLFARREQTRRDCQEKMESDFAHTFGHTQTHTSGIAMAAGRPVSTNVSLVRSLGRINLISDIRVENS